MTNSNNALRTLTIPAGASFNAVTKIHERASRAAGAGSVCVVNKTTGAYGYRGAKGLVLIVSEAR